MSKIKPEGVVKFPVAADQSDPAVRYHFWFRGLTDADSGPLRQSDGAEGLADNHVELADSTPDADGNIVVDLDALELPKINGTLRVALSAVDSHGNESDLSPDTDVPFDDVAPAAPGAGVFVPAS